jgi:uncharacterized protein YjdB
VVRIEVTPAGDTLAPGESRRLVATAYDALGGVDSTASFDWRSDPADVVVVSSTGVAVAHSLGTARIEAVSRGQSGQATITVRELPVFAVEITPPLVELSIGDTVRLTATVKDSLARPLQTKTVVWSSLVPDVASVSATGLLLGLSAGETRVTATSERQSASIRVRVDAAPAVVR